MSTDGTTDRRRFGVIEVRYRTVGKLAMYNLTINGKLWACVEWSPSRKGWCIQDGSGRCLSHCDAIHGQDIDAQTAVKLAKAMIRDGIYQTALARPIVRAGRKGDYFEIRPDAMFEMQRPD